LTFGAGGTFEVSITYTPNDANYSSATLTNAISIDVS
jgi:hypothetical protein